MTESIETLERTRSQDVSPGPARTVESRGAARAAGFPSTLAFLASAFLVALPVDANWPSFRNGGSGSTTVGTAPAHWTPAGRGIAWRAEIPGYGQSAPVVWGDRVYVTSSDGPWQERQLVHAFELGTGRILWSAEVPATTRVENYFRNSRAAPTSVVDADRVVSFFPSGDVVALDHDGKELWSFPLFRRFGSVENDRAPASSLAQTEELVFALVDHGGPSYLVALRKTDGSVAWKADRGNRVPSWSSPAVTSVDGRELVVVSSADTVEAFAATSGDRLFALDGVEGNRIPSASVVDGSIYVGSTELAHGGGGARSVAASNSRIDLQERDETVEAGIRWRAKRATASYSTPLAFDGYVYFVNKSGILYCLDAETGDELYRHRLGGPSWTSAIGARLADGTALVYFVLKSGETLVLRPGRTYDEVARNRLWSEEDEIRAAEVARRQRASNRAPTDEAARKDGPEAQLAAMPEAQLHQMFSYGDPIAYGIALVDGCLLVRAGQELTCIGG